MIVVAAIGLKAFGPAAGWLAALFLALLPGHAHFSQLGYRDHHAAVALMVAVVFGVTMALLRDRPAEPSARGAWWRSVAL